MKDWLTDDNIEYIIKNSIPIQTALTGKDIKIFDDIANTYFAFKVAQKGNSASISEVNQLNLFKQEFNLQKKEINLLPVRVSGNHWGLIIIDGYAKEVFYSSSSESVDSEKEQIKPLACFLVDDTIGNSLIQDFYGAKQNNGSDCGVYIIKYIQEIVEDSFSNYTLNGVYSDSDINDFRNEWKTKIGESKWCAESGFDAKGDDWTKLGIIGEIEIKKWFDENAPIGKKGFTFLDTQKLINFGFKPYEADFAKWLRTELEKESKDVSDIEKFLTNINNLETSRKDYQKKDKQKIDQDKLETETDIEQAEESQQDVDNVLEEAKIEAKDEKKDNVPPVLPNPNSLKIPKEKEPKQEVKEEQPKYLINNCCWLHNFSYSGGGSKGKTLEEKEITAKGDYDNNLKIIFSPNKKELDQEELLKEIESEKEKTELLQLAIDKILSDLEVNNFDELNDKIQDKEQRILALRLDRDDLVTELTGKGNRIAQLDQTIKGSAVIFQRQINIIDDLTQQLEIEHSNQNIDSKVYQDRIRELNKNKTDLNKRIQELEDEETKSKTLRDVELVDLRNQIVQKNAQLTLFQTNNDQLTKDYNNLQVNLNASNQTITNLRTQISNLNNQIISLSLRPTQEQYTFINNQLTTARNELDKEKNWWDKWAEQPLINNTDSEIGKSIYDSISKFRNINAVNSIRYLISIEMKNQKLSGINEKNSSVVIDDFSQPYLLSDKYFLYIFKGIYNYYRNK